MMIAIKMNNFLIDIIDLLFNKKTNITGMKIRKAMKEDLDACLEIERPPTEKKISLFRVNFIKELDDVNFEILVAEMGKEIVGFVVYRRDEWNNMFYVEQLFVKHKGRGYGSSLLSEVKKRAKNLKIRVIMLDLQPENRGAMRFYKRNGFVKAGHINGLFDDSERPDGVILAFHI
jgi:ribosomal protein S18 acetylase RimI-like enzyme